MAEEPDLNPGQCRFESYQGHHRMVAQAVERPVETRKVVGAAPTHPAKRGSSITVNASVFQTDEEGSIPSYCSIPGYSLMEKARAF